MEKNEATKNMEYDFQDGRLTEEMLAEYISIGADRNTAILLAARCNYMDKVKRLARFGATNAKDETGRTILMYVAMSGDTNTITALIKEGAAVNAKSEGGVTALMCAAYNGRTDAVKTLAKFGAKINNDDGLTALMDAAEQEHEDTVKAFIALGVDLNAKDADGWTVCMKAAFMDKISAVKTFVKLGADIYAENKNGLTALDCITDEDVKKEIIQMHEEYKKNHPTNEVLKENILEIKAEHRKEMAMLKLSDELEKLNAINITINSNGGR